MSHSQKSNRQRKGLTLIELLAVLVILVAVAGTLVPLIPNVNRQSHAAAGADNIKEITKSLLLYQQLNNGQFPNLFDSLIDENGALAPGVEFDADGEVNALGGGGDDDTIITALTDAGITDLMEHLSTSTNVTFEPYDDPAVNFPIDATATIAQLTAGGIDALGLEPLAVDGTIAYVALGVGARNTAIGNTMIDAPVHFPEGDEGPAEAYARFAAIFAISSDGVAELATVVAIHEGVVGLSGHIEEYFE